MSKFNFHQAITEINKNGYVVTNLEQKPERDGSYMWYCSIANEKGHVLTASAPLPIPALEDAISSMHAQELSVPVEDDCDLV